MKPLFRLLTELSSRKMISRCVGGFAKSRMSKRLIRTFSKTYNIQVDEAELPLESYLSLNEFFTRKLKAGARPIDTAPDTLISPVDAQITGMGQLQSDQLLNIKGQDYDLHELLGHSPRCVNYKNGYYIILYLSPSDYHRIHAPITGKLVEKEHIAGKVYPVHDFSMRHIRKVLSRNERLISYIQHHQKGEVAVVKVGALNVSSIRYADPLPDMLERGDELAMFEFGSTVVLLMEKDAFTPGENLQVGNRVKMGQSLGLFRLDSK